jgi:hypothetical protein
MMPPGLVVFASGAGPAPAAEHQEIAAELTRRAVAEVGFVTSGRLRAELDLLRPHLMVVDAGFRPAVEAAVERAVPFILTTPLPSSAVPARRPARRRVGRRFRAPAWSHGDAATAVFGFSVPGLEDGASRDVHMLGPMVPAAAPGLSCSLEEWLYDHETIVYVAGDETTLTCRRLCALFAAFARLAPPHHVLWSLPAAQRELLPPRQAWPDHVRVEDPATLATGVLPHPHVRACVSGGRRFHESLYFETPVLILPAGAESAEFAARAVTSGTGLAAGDFAADQVLGALARLLSDRRFQDQAVHWGRLLRQAGGVTRAADLIADRLGADPPPSRDPSGRRPATDAGGIDRRR